MRDKKQRNTALFSIFLLLLSIFPFSAFSFAEEKTVELQVTNASLATEDGKEITKDNPITPGEGVAVTLDWQIEKDTLLENGMKAIFTLPGELNFPDATGLLADNMGSYQVKDQVMTMIFTQNYTTTSNAEGVLEAVATDYQGKVTLAAKSYEEKAGQEVVTFSAGAQPILYYESKSSEGQTNPVVASEKTTTNQVAETLGARRAPMDLTGTYNIVSNLVMKDSTGAEVNATNPLVDPSKVTLSFDWFLQDNWDVIGEDTYTIQLPAIFEIYNAVIDSPLTAESGQVYGKFSATTDGKLTITFAKEIEKVDGRSGKINLISTIDKEQLTENNEIKTGIYDEDNNEIILSFATDAPDIQKQGVANQNDEITWTILFNSERKSLTDVVLSEELPAGTVYSYMAVSYNANPDPSGTPNWQSIPAQETAGGVYNWKAVDESGVRKITFINKWKTFDSQIKIILYTKTNDKTLVKYRNKVTINGANFVENSAEAEVSLDESENYKRLMSYDLNTGVINWEVKVQASSNNLNWWDKTYASEDYASAMHYFDKASFEVTKDGVPYIPAITFMQSATVTGDTEPTYVKITGLDQGSYVIKYQTKAKTVPIVPGTKIVNYAASEKGNMGGEITLKPSTPETAEKIGVKKNCAPYVDYNNNRISWNATVNQNGIHVKNLVINDIFQNSGGQPYAENLDRTTLKIYSYDKGNETGKTTLKENIDYKFEMLSPYEWGDRGFKITLLGEYADTDKVFYLEYDTIVNPEKHKELWPYSNIVGNYIYAGFVYGEGNDETVYYEDAFSSTTLWGYYKQGGGKTGLFMEKGSLEYNASYPFGTKDSGEVLESDKIYWNIILNTYKNNLPKDTIIKDLPDSKLPEANHEVDASSYQIFNISYGEGKDNTKIKLGEKWEVDVDYEVSADGSIKLLEPTNSPFAIFLMTDVTKMTNSYTNKAVMTVPGGKEYSYEGTVSRQTNDQWINKEGAQVVTETSEGTSTIEWNVVFNKRSRRVENAKITDTISYGKHTFKKDSEGKTIVKIYEAKLDAQAKPLLGDLVTSDQYTVKTTEDLEAGTQTLTIEFVNTVEKMYVVQYETVIDEYLSGTEQVSNKAVLTGDEVDSITVEKEVEVKYTTGSGTSSGKTSSLTIAKVADDPAQTPLKASFMLYRGQGENRETTPLFSEPIVVDGILSIQNLRNGQYSLQEVAGPEGNYTFDKDCYYEVEVVSKEEANATAPDITIVNHEVIDISGEKTWAKETNTSARPDKIEVSLVTGSERPQEYTDKDLVPGSTQTTDETNDWKYSWTDLRKYDDEGNEIKYWVVETAVAGYETSYDGNNITNTRVPDMYTVKGTKTWNHGDNAEAKQPDAINVWLVYGESRESGKKIADSDQVVKADKEGNWSYSWTLNPDIYPDQEKVWVVEEAVERYETTYDGTNITNTWIAPELYTVKGKKTWNHGDNAEAKQPDAINVWLVYGESREAGKKIADSDQVVKADKDGNWSYSWTLNPDIYPDQDKVWVVEEAIERYETTYDGTNITNTWITPELYTVKGTKTWEHGDNAEAKQPDGINVWLVYGESREAGKKIADSDQVVKADKEGNWSYSWTLNPDVYPDQDKVWVVEDKVEDYRTNYDKDSYDVKNTWIEPEKPVDSTEPSTTEPSTTEPSTTEPSTTESSTTEPSTTEPSTTEPSTTEPSTTEPSTTEPSTTEPSDSGTPINSSDRPKLPDTKQPTTESQTSGTRKQLPKTGEVYRGFFSIFGGLILTLVGFLYWKRRSEQKG